MASYIVIDQLVVFSARFSVAVIVPAASPHYPFLLSDLRARARILVRIERLAAGNPGDVKALGDIARAKGMSQVARDAGLSRESLHKALSGDRSPGFDTILKVICS